MPTPLGSTEAHNYAQQEFDVTPGDLLVLYTDGVPEAEGSDGAELGEKALRAMAQEAPKIRDGRGAEALRDRIRDQVLAFRGTRPQKDDICLVIGEFV